MFNAFAILTGHVSCTVAITSTWGVTAKLAQIFLLYNFMERQFILTTDLSNLFLIKLRTFSFLLKGSTLWLLFGISELLLLCFGATVK